MLFCSVVHNDTHTREQFTFCMLGLIICVCLFRFRILCVLTCYLRLFCSYIACFCCVGFSFFLQYLVKRLAGQNVSEMTCGT